MDCLHYCFPGPSDACGASLDPFHTLTCHNALFLLPSSLCVVVYSHFTLVPPRLKFSPPRWYVRVACAMRPQVGSGSI